MIARFVIRHRSACLASFNFAVRAALRRILDCIRLRDRALIEEPAPNDSAELSLANVAFPIATSQQIVNSQGAEE